jgi:hypothetical protein
VVSGTLGKIDSFIDLKSGNNPRKLEIFTVTISVTIGF